MYKAGGISRFNFLNSSDEVQQIKSRVLQTDEQINVLISQAGREASDKTRLLLNLEAQLVDLNEDRNNLLLQSGSPGRIFNLSVQPGSVISPGSELMRIIPEGDLKLVCIWLTQI